MGTRDNDGSVSSMQTDPVEVRLMTDKYFEEQASLGNSEATKEIEKRVVDFTRAEVFRGLKFVTDEKQMLSTESLAMFVIPRFVRARNVDSAEVTARRGVMWWSSYGSLVGEALNRRRAEAMSNVKIRLVGT